MALVDYSSSGSAEADDAGPPPPKRRKAAKTGIETGALGVNGAGLDLSKPKTTGGPDVDMPPLPASFHDMYASTVRQSVVDNPALHQGRKRQTPHVAGRWPTHVYVEWHPTAAQHGVLTKLLGEVERILGPELELHNFLSSDLGAPLPLHISLSRPITLSTGNKDDFLDKVSTFIREGGMPAFTVRPLGLAWYKSPDSNRVFLIIRVTNNSDEPGDDSNGNDDVDTPRATNPQLTALLRRCNAAATLFEQPALYQRTQGEPVGDAFHISIGWTFGLPPEEETALEALRLFKLRRFAEVRRWGIEVGGVKVKIGNVVSHVALTGGEGFSRRPV